MFTGRKHSEETKRKIGQSSKGRKHSEASKREMSVLQIGTKNSFYGKHHTEEVKKKISLITKGKNNPNWKGGVFFNKDKKEYWNNRNRQIAKQKRKEVFNHYGQKCVCCGETTYEFLVIHHTNGGGNQHRKKVGYGTKFYTWLIKNSFPEGYQILCHNCNMAKGFYGECPHDKNRV